MRPCCRDPRRACEAWGAAGSSSFLTTHYLDEADALCDRILVIDHGAIVAEGTPDQPTSQVGGDVLT